MNLPACGLPLTRPTPPHLAALEGAAQAAIGTREKVMNAPPPTCDAQYERREHRLATARLRMAQELDALTTQDQVPARHAQHYHADLLQGAAMLMAHAEGQGCAIALEALLLAGLRHHRSVHNHHAPALMAPSVLWASEEAAALDGGQGTAGFVLRNTQPVGSHASTASAFMRVVSFHIAAGGLTHDSEPSRRTCPTHESVHEAQVSRVEPMNADPFGFSSSRLPALPSGPDIIPVPLKAHARALHVQAAAALPLAAADPPEHSHRDSLYRTRPDEVQAFFEQSFVSRALVADGVHRHGVKTEVDALAATLAAALGNAAARLVTNGRSRPDRLVLLFEKHANIFGLAGGLMHRLADLHRYSHSPAFGSAEQHELRRACERIKALDGNRPEALVEARTILDAAIGTMRSRHGLLLDAHAGAQEVDFEPAKSHPVRHAAQALGVAEPHLRASLDQLLGASGLASHVQQLQTLTQGPRTAQAEAVQATVMDQAAAWLGLDNTTPGLPPVRVNLFDAPAGPIPRVAGINTGPGPARSIEFDVLTWQLHVPAHLIQQARPEELGRALAKAGLDVATSAALLTWGYMPDSVTPVESVDLGAISSATRKHLEASFGPGSDAPGFPDQSPLLAAALVATLQRPDPTRPGTPWHTGRRPGLKVAARAGDLAAEAAYQSNARARWDNPMIALRRAAGDMGATLTKAPSQRL